jgi:hypothetical protein
MKRSRIFATSQRQGQGCPQCKRSSSCNARYWRRNRERWPQKSWRTSRRLRQRYCRNTPLRWRCSSSQSMTSWLSTPRRTRLKEPPCCSNLCCTQKGSGFWNQKGSGMLMLKDSQKMTKKRVWWYLMVAHCTRGQKECTRRCRTGNSLKWKWKWCPRRGGRKRSRPWSHGSTLTRSRRWEALQACTAPPQRREAPQTGRGRGALCLEWLPSSAEVGRRSVQWRGIVSYLR